MADQSEIVTVEFNEEGDFAALRAAEAWCRERGVSYGSTDRSHYIGLIARPNVHVSKWRNLTKKEQRECDGTIFGDARHGPLTLRISRAALASNGWNALEIETGAM